jgi:pyruvate/2-oxoglutarate dehydrogenase complex dihydrolipoamide acyltransferase (E2) component
MSIDVKVPFLGDGVASGDVLQVLVKEGDSISKDQGIIELETDKATVEVPSSHAGKVQKVHVRVGQTLQIGATLITLEGTAAAAPAAPAKAAPAVAKPAPGATAKPAAAKLPPQAELKPPPKAESRPTAPPTPAARPTPEPATAFAAQAEAPPAETTGTVAAGPAVRRFARELGIDLRRVSGTGPGGRITRDDVLHAVRQASRAATVALPVPRPGPGAPSTDAWGPIRMEKMPRIRQAIAAQMQRSWETCPRVTNFDDVDITELERIRQSSKDDYAARGIKLTSLPFVIKAVAMSLRAHPAVNASLDVETSQIIYKDYVNIGIAVDTERGLVVPSLRNADRLTIPDIARALAVIAENARQNSFSLDDLRGSTFSISNLGAVGGTYSTPIINVPEVAVLLVGRSRKTPVVMDNDQIAVRLMMPLSLSYDHRLVDGAVAARFLNDVIGFLKAPGRLLLAP